MPIRRGASARPLSTPMRQHILNYTPNETKTSELSPVLLNPYDVGRATGFLVINLSPRDDDLLGFSAATNSAECIVKTLVTTSEDPEEEKIRMCI